MGNFRLPESVSSLHDVRTLHLELKDYERWFAHEAIKHQVGAKHVSAKPELSAATSDTLRSWFADHPQSSHSLDELLDRLKHIESSASQLTVTLAAPATSDIKVALISWFRHNIGPDVLVSFQFSSTLLGGMVVRSGSRMFDWSFRRQIMENRAKFPEVLRRV